MRKKLVGQYPTKAKKREIKNRPRMRVSGASLKRSMPHAGQKLTSR